MAAAFVRERRELPAMAEEEAERAALAEKAVANVTPLRPETVAERYARKAILARRLRK